MGYQEIVKRTFDLARCMMRAAGCELFVIAGIYNDDDREECAVVKGWAGGESAYDGRLIEAIAHLNALEVMMGDLIEDFSMSPVSGRVLTTGKMGAVRSMTDDYMQNVISVGGEAQRCNAMLALLFCKAMEYEVRFHHVTHGYENLEELLEVVEAEKKRLGIEPLDRHQEGQASYIFRVQDDAAPNKVYWIEHAYGASIHPWSIQWHVVMDSYEYLEPAERIFSAETYIDQDAGLGDLQGEVWQFANNVHRLGIAFYNTWIELE